MDRKISIAPMMDWTVCAISPSQINYLSAPGNGRSLSVASPEALTSGGSYEADEARSSRSRSYITGAELYIDEATWPLRLILTTYRWSIGTDASGGLPYSPRLPSKNISHYRREGGRRDNLPPKAPLLTSLSACSA